jgi:hypothetical protein
VHRCPLDSRASEDWVGSGAKEQGIEGKNQPTPADINTNPLYPLKKQKKHVIASAGNYFFVRKERLIVIVG